MPDRPMLETWPQFCAAAALGLLFIGSGAMAVWWFVTP